MGEFNAGKWIIIILVYYFVMFISIYTVIEVSSDLGTDINIQAPDPSFQNALTPLEENGYCRSGNSIATAFCSWTNANDNTSCSYLNGCTWDNVTGVCTGTPILIDFGGRCSPLMNDTICNLFKCEWVVTDNPDNNERISLESSLSSPSDIKKTISIMTGFSPEFGIPKTYNLIFSFFAFWLPSLLLIWCLYMALPFAH